MMHIFRITAAIAVATSLTACGGSSTNADMTPSRPPQANGFAAIEQRGTNLAERFAPAIEGERYTDLSTLPTSGTLSYSGSGAYVLGVAAPVNGQNIVDNADVISRIDMQVQLDNGQVNGSASEFYYTANRERIDGRLAIRGSLDRTADTSTDYGLAGTMTGTLRDQAAEQIRVETEMFADLYGPNAGALFGFADGEARTIEGTNLVRGVFIAERR